MTTSTLLKTIENERGALTLDFIFALVLTFGFTIVFFAISVTLSMVEVTQYIAYSASRSYSGAHETQQAQEALGQKKYAELMGSPIFKRIYGLNWVTLQAPSFGDFNSLYPQSPSDDVAVFWGVRIPMTANILNMKIPLLGSTTTNSSTGKATISSYLMREVTTTECRETFNRARFQNIKNLSTGGKSAYGGIPTDSAALITDNGC